MYKARTFGNDSCPATSFTKGYTDSRQHTFCYGPYATGDLDVNITARLGLCCNCTTTTDPVQAAPVEVVLDDMGCGLPVTGNCWLPCNATYLKDLSRAVGGEVAAFGAVSKSRSTTGALYGIAPKSSTLTRCIARETSGATSRTLVLSPYSTCKLVFGLLALIAFATAYT